MPDWLIPTASICFTIAVTGGTAAFRLGRMIEKIDSLSGRVDEIKEEVNGLWSRTNEIRDMIDGRGPAHAR